MEDPMQQLKHLAAAALTAAWLGLTFSVPSFAQQTASVTPNILVIMADDIGYWNISAYNRGQMGYRTPNIDRIATEGALFTDYYGQQSCTAGRAAFITGQSPMRTGLLKASQGGAARREGRAFGQGPDAGRTAQTAGLHDGPIRQEPPRRPQ
jgi:hypothetical protein